MFRNSCLCQFNPIIKNKCRVQGGGQAWVLLLLCILFSQILRFSMSRSKSEELNEDVVPVENRTALRAATRHSAGYLKY